MIGRFQRTARQLRSYPMFEFGLKRLLDGAPCPSKEAPSAAVHHRGAT
jgi:hypothetical protein